MQSKRCRSWKGLVLPIAAFLLWLGLGAMGKLNTTLFPSPQDVWQAFCYLWQGGLFWSHVSSSLLRIALGFSLAIIVGVPLGMILGCLPQSQIWFGPILHFLRQIPPIALVPLFLLWFGIGEGSKLAVIFYAAVFPIVINATLGVQQIPKEYWEVSRALCLSPSKRLQTLILPGCYQTLFTGLRLGMGMSWRAIVAAEMLASSSGLGYLVMSARSLARIDEMFVGIVIIGCIGLLIDRVFVALQSQIIPFWRWSSSTSGGEEFANTPVRVGTRFQEV